MTEITIEKLWQRYHEGCPLVGLAEAYHMQTNDLYQKLKKHEQDINRREEATDKTNRRRTRQHNVQPSEVEKRPRGRKKGARKADLKQLKKLFN